VKAHPTWAHFLRTKCHSSGRSLRVFA
jgi:hypothetical protein